MNHRKFIWQNMQKTRRTPGYEKVYLMETAPQLGVRITRVLAGLQDRDAGRSEGRHASSPTWSASAAPRTANTANGRSPTARWCPDKLDNLLAAGRCISAEMRMADLVRLIPNCFVTGHAAGVAAAVAAKDGCQPRDVEVPKVQKILREQNAYLGES